MFMPTGTTALKELVLSQVAQLELYGDGISTLYGWDEVSTYLLKLSLRKGILTEGDIRAALHERLLELGRKCYEQHKKTGTYPDHASSPHAFAYAIHNDEFKQAELSKIEFDHGETLETFMGGEIHDLPEKTLDKLIRWKKPEESGVAGFPACC
jgi:hypothetical protein